MKSPEVNIVTGAFGYTGNYIAKKLLSMGEKVKTLISHPNHIDPFCGQVEAVPFNFDNPAALIEDLRGVKTLYNTYWIRFSRGNLTFDNAIQNTRTLVKCAREAGVQRIVHISVTNPSLESPLPYYKGKAITENVIIESGLPYTIIRPTLIFELGDILINNIAWLFRRFPVFAIPGNGKYQLQPISAEDVADIAINSSIIGEDIVDAAGPDIFTFDEMVRLIAKAVNSKTRIIHANPTFALTISSLIGYIVHDVILTKDELDGLAANLLVSEQPPLGKIRLSGWLQKNSDSIGLRYASELHRHYR